MGIEDLYANVPLPASDPQSLGVPALPPAPAPPPAPAAAPGPNPQAKILQMIALGLLAAKGRSVSGLGAGLAAGQQQVQQTADRRRIETERVQNQQRDDYRAQQEDYQRQVQAQQMETQRRSQLLLQNLNTLKTGLMSAKDQAGADQLLDFYGNALTQAGFRGYDANSLRAQGYRYYAPDVKTTLSTKLDKLFQTPNDLMKERAKSADVFTDLLTYTDPASKVQKTISVKDAIKLTDYPVTMGQDGQPFAITSDKGKAREMTPTEAVGYVGQVAKEKAALIAAGAVDNKATDDLAEMNATKEMAKREKASRDITGVGQSGVAAAPDQGGLSPAGVEYAATQYRVTGVMPPMGMGKTPDRAKIINATAEQARLLKQSPAVAIQKQAAYKSDAAALTQIRRMQTSAEAFETKASAQADIVKGLSARVPRTQYPIINNALLSGRANIQGDANTQLLFNALTTFTTEYAKILEGATGSAAGASDSARAAAARLVTAGLNKGTLAQTIDLMQREMDLTLQGYDATIEHITGRMGGVSPASPDAGATARQKLGLP